MGNTPFYPDRLAERAWQQGKALKPPSEEGGPMPVPGFPGYRYDLATGRLWRETYKDRRGRTRGGREVRTRLLKGGSHFRLFKDGRMYAISAMKLAALVQAGLQKE